MDIKGGAVIVTGSATGVGAAAAKLLASKGCNVVINYTRSEAEARETQAECEALGVEALLCKADVSDDADCRRMAAETMAKWGRIDGLINNAGMLVRLHVSHVPFNQIPEDEWDAVFETNVKSVWTVTRAVAPHMQDGKGGSIVNMSSGAVFKATATRAHYVASKAAVIGLSRTLAKELGADWIRVNCIAPGAVLSEEDPDESIIRNREKASAQRALQRIEYPEDVVGTAVYLLSDDSAFVTGQVIVVDGGIVAH